MVNFTRTLEIAGTSGFVQPIKLVQYDATLPVGVFELVENGQPFDIPAGAKAKVRMRKADGKGVYNDATISGHTVQVVVTQQMTAAFGVGFLNIELSYDGGVKSSEPVQVVVLENAVQQGAIESADEFLTLDEIVKQVETLRQQTATDAASAASSKTAAASSATAAQSARAGAEAAESRVNSIVAGNESYTKRQSRDMFARALKATAEKAEKLEIYPDDGSNVAVTAYGYTEQAGTGDPSPTNLREISVGGKKLMEVVFDGSSDEAWASWVISEGKNRFAIQITNGAQADTGSNIAYSSRMKLVGQGQIGQVSFKNVFTVAPDGKLFVRADTESLDVFKSQLAARPITFWLPTTDGTGKYYTPIESTGAEYSCVCVPLTEHLCDGDTVETCVKSGCDKVVVFDGSEDEGWLLESSSATSASGSRRFILKALSQYPSDNIDNDKIAKGYSSYLFGYTPNGTYGDSIIDDCFSMQAESVHARISGVSTIESLRKHLSAHPLTVWYRSANYTEDDDIAVSLETHQQAALVLDGTENWGTWGIGLYRFVTSLKGTNTSNGKCSHIPYVYSFAGNGIFVDKDGNVAIGTGFIAAQGYQSASDWKAYLSAQYAAGTPVTIVYELNTPITYAHDPVYLEAYPDGNGKFTVSGEKLVSAVYNKSLSKAFEELQAAVLATGAKLSS